MRVIIFDDDIQFLEIMKESVSDNLDKQGEEYELLAVNTLSEWDRAIGAGKPDLVLLDIDMPEKNGMEVAEELRTRYDDVDIIFLTIREDMVFESIRYAPFRFIRKSKKDEELYEALASYVEKCNANRKFININVEGVEVPVKVRDIVYVESSGHNLNVVAKDNVYEIRKKISEMEKELQEYGFVRVQKSYVVNLIHVKKIEKKVITLSTGKVISLQRGIYSEVATKYYEYKRKRFNGNSC